MRERDVERYLVAKVKATGGEIRKAQWIGRAHAPDRFAWWPLTRQWPLRSNGPRAVWIELKAPGEKPRAGQKREHDRMRAAGNHVWVIDDIERVDILISRYGIKAGEELL